MPSTPPSRSPDLPPPPAGWASPPPALALAPGEFHAWRIPLDVPVGASPDLLSPDERTRADRLKAPGGRGRFIAGRAALRAILGRYLGVAGDRLTFRYGHRGKPALATDLAAPLEFNLTHSAGLAILAVGGDRAVGVDVEELRPMPDAARLVERFFSAREQRDFLALAEPDRLAAFFRCWTRKEAYMKATGEGLGTPLDGFDVSLAPGAAPRLLAVAARPAEADRWSMADVDPSPGFVAALAAEGEIRRLLLYRWDAADPSPTA